jgi:hypothetical protein
MSATDLDESVWTKASPELLSKLCAAALEVDEIEKDGTNKFHHYDYSSIEAVARATRDPLLSRGIFVIPEILTTTDRTRNTREGESVVTTAELSFTVFDSETGERLIVQWAGRGDDPADKGLSKAITDARKTFLIAFFNAPRGEDTEADESTDQRTPAPAGSVNMSDEAKGLTNAQLNAALVSVGLPAQEKPWSAFMRVSPEHITALREALRAERERR